MSQNALSYQEPTPRQLRRQEWIVKRTAELAEGYRRKVVRLAEAVPEVLRRVNHRGVVYAYDEQLLRDFIAAETGVPFDHQPETLRLVADAITYAIDNGWVCALKNKDDGLVAYHLPVDELHSTPGPKRKFLIAAAPKEITATKWTVLLASGTFITNHQGVSAQYVHAAPSRHISSADDDAHYHVPFGLSAAQAIEWYL